MILERESEDRVGQIRKSTEVEKDAGKLKKEKGQNLTLMAI